jgi:hypothetical protein
MDGYNPNKYLQDIYNKRLGREQADATKVDLESTGINTGIVPLDVTINTVSGLVEPFTVLQDTFFNIVGGIYDRENGTIMERLNGNRGFLNNLLTYAPFGAVPERSTTGYDIAKNVLDVRDENAARVAGAGLELFADPLLFGGVVTAIGKASRIDDLVKVGTTFDKYMSPMTYVKAGAGSIDSLLPQIRKTFDKVYEFAANPSNTFLGIEMEQYSKFLEYLPIPKTNIAKIRLGADVGQQVSIARRKVQIDGSRISAEGGQFLTDFMKELYDPIHLNAVGRLNNSAKNGLTAITDVYYTTMPINVKKSLDVTVSTILDEVGALSMKDIFFDPTAPLGASKRSPVLDILKEGEERFLTNNPTVLNDPTTFGGISKSVEEKAFDSFNVVPITQRDKVSKIYQTARSKFAKDAKDNGMDNDWIANTLSRLDNAVTMAITHEANYALELSGYQKIKDSLMLSIVDGVQDYVNEPLFVAQEIWTQVLAHAYSGKQLKDMTTFRVTDNMAKLFNDAGNYSIPYERYMKMVSKTSRSGSTLNPNQLDNAAYQAVQAQATKQSSIGNMFGSNYLMARAEMLKDGGGDMNLAMKYAQDAQLGLDAATAFTPLQKANYSRQLEKMAKFIDISLLRQNGMTEIPISHLFGGQYISKRKTRVRSFSTGFAAQGERNRGKKILGADIFNLGSFRNDKNQFNNPMQNRDDYISAADLVSSSQLNKTFGVDVAIRGLFTGHLRQSYSGLLDTPSMSRHIDNLKRGLVIPNTVLDEVLIDSHVTDVDSAQILKDYTKIFERDTVATIVGDSSVNKVKHANLRSTDMKSSIVQNLTSKGVGIGEAKMRAEKAVSELVVGSTGSPVFKEIMREVEDFATKFKSEFDSKSISTLDSQQLKLGSAAFAKRSTLSPEAAEALGKIYEPLIVLEQSVRAASSTLSRQNYVDAIYKIGKDNGLIVNANEHFRKTKQGSLIKNGAKFSLISGREDVYGAFGNSFVHPNLKLEVDKILVAPKSKIPFLFEMLRNRITANYLASPRVTVGNALGGFFQPLMMGTPMIPLLKNFFSELPKIAKKLANPLDPYDIADELAEGGVDIIGSSQLAEEFSNHVTKYAIDLAELQPNGGAALISKLDTMYTDFLRKPFGNKYLGLDGFQFFESAWKAAAYKTEKDIYLQSGKTAAEAFTYAVEKARLSVFDYTDLPYVLENIRSYGVLPLPGYPFFALSRTINSFMNHPQVLKTMDKIPEAIQDIAVDQETAAAIYVGMDDWLKNQNGVPIYVTKDREGNNVATVIPMGQIIPSAGLEPDNNIVTAFGQNFGSAGLWGPLFELVNAIFISEGEKTLSAQYGGTVFNKADSNIDKFKQGLQFLFEAYAPAGLNNVSGIVNAVKNSSIRVSDNLDSLYTLQELTTGKVSRNVVDEVIATFFRTPQKVALDGDLSGLRKSVEALDRDRRDDSNYLTKKITDAYVRYGKGKEVDNLIERLRNSDTKYAAQIKRIADTYRAYDLSRPVEEE